MSLDGQTLLVGFSEFLDDLFQGTTDDAGAADGSTLVCGDLQRFGADGLAGGWLRARSGAALNEVRRVDLFTGSTATLTNPFSAQVASGVDFEFHRYDPAKKFLALDRARILAFPQLAVLQVDETLTADGHNFELSLPSTMRKGPMEVWAEEPISPQVQWQLLSNPALTSADSWTASGLTATAQARSIFDMLVPRLEQTCLMLQGNGTLSQPVGNMVTGMSAALAAGRDVAFGVWLYSLTAGPTVRVTDDVTYTESSAHLGRGWQFLQVSRPVTTLNATTLTASIHTNADITVYVERAYAGFLKAIPLLFPHVVVRAGVRRDAETQKVYLRAGVARGLQLRLVGRSPLSALGTDPDDQTTNEMEVDELNADLLYATAARLLFTWEGWTADTIEAFPRLQAVAQRFIEQEETSRVKYPSHGYLSVL